MENVKNTKNKHIYEHFSAVKSIGLEEMISRLPQSEREEIISEYDAGNLSEIFADKGLTATALAFLENGMNVSATARKLYMHRNTLMYKLKIIRKTTGLDLRDFDMAVTFRILYILYNEK